MKLIAILQSNIFFIILIALALSMVLVESAGATPQGQVIQFNQHAHVKLDVSTAISSVEALQGKGMINYVNQPITKSIKGTNVLFDDAIEVPLSTLGNTTSISKTNMDAIYNEFAPFLGNSVIDSVIAYNIIKNIPYGFKYKNNIVPVNTKLNYTFVNANGILTLYKVNITKATPDLTIVVDGAQFHTPTSTEYFINPPVLNGQNTYNVTGYFAGSADNPLSYVMNIIDTTNGITLLSSLITAKTVETPFSFQLPISHHATLAISAVGNANYTNSLIDPVTNPISILTYIPYTIVNSNTAATTDPIQIKITVNSLALSAYAQANLKNAEWFYGNGVLINSWIEQSNSNTLTNTIYWLSINGLAANGVQTTSGMSCNGIASPGGNDVCQVYLGFASFTSNLIDGVVTGLAPTLPSNICSGVNGYGACDNGATVFPKLYQNFKGTTLPSGWSNTLSACTVFNNGAMVIKDISGPCSIKTDATYYDQTVLLDMWGQSDGTGIFSNSGFGFISDVGIGGEMFGSTGFLAINDIGPGTVGTITEAINTNALFTIQEFATGAQFSINYGATEPIFGTVPTDPVGLATWSGNGANIIINWVRMRSQTFGVTSSNTVPVSSCSTPIIPVNVIFYTCITLQNNQGTGVAASTPVRFNYNGLNYTAYETSTLNNTMFFLANGMTLNSFIEGNTLNLFGNANALSTSGNVTIWVQTPATSVFLGPNSRNNIYMGFAGNTVTAANNLWTTSIGGSGYLTNTIVGSNSCAKYDSGGNVFLIYYSFCSIAALPTGWTQRSGTLTFKPSNIQFTGQASGTTNGLFLSSANSMPYSFNTPGNSIDITAIVLPGGSQQDFGVAQTVTGGTSLARWVYDFRTGGGGGPIGFATNGKVNALAPNAISANLVIYTFVYTNAVSGNVLVNYNALTAIGATAGNPLTVDTTSTGVFLKFLTFDASTFSLYNVRTRTMPPNTVMPTATFSPIASSASASLTLSNTLIDQGQSIVFTGTFTGGMAPYTYNFIVTNSANPATPISCPMFSPFIRCGGATGGGANSLLLYANAAYINEPQIFAYQVAWTPSTTATLTLNSGGNVFRNSITVNAIIEAFHTNGLPVCFSVGGSSQNGIIVNTILSNSVQRVQLWSEGTNMIRTYHFDCVQWDFEYGSTGLTYANYSPFLAGWVANAQAVNPKFKTKIFLAQFYTQGAQGIRVGNIVPYVNAIEVSGSLVSQIQSFWETGNSVPINMLEDWFDLSDGSAAQTIAANSEIPLAVNRGYGIGAYSTYFAGLGGGTYYYDDIANAIQKSAVVVVNQLLVGSPSATNTFIWTPNNAFYTSNSFKANLVITDSVGNVKSTSYTFLGYNSAPAITFTQSNSALDVNQYDVYTVVASGGTEPYTVNIYWTNNGVNAYLVSNVLAYTATNFVQQYTVQGSYTLNAIITDSATTPVSANAVQLTTTVAADPQGVVLFASNAVIDQGQTEVFTATITGGLSPYTYNFILSNTANALPIIANKINIGVAGVSNVFTFVVPSTNNALGTLTYTGNIDDSAPILFNVLMTNTITINKALTVTTPTISNVLLVPGQGTLLSITVGGGSSTYTYNWIVQNTVTGTIIANALYVACTIKSNSFFYLPTVSDYGNTLKVNVVVTDSASTPVTVSSAYGSTIITGVSLIVSNKLIDQNQVETVKYSLPDGKSPYFYNFTVLNSANSVVWSPNKYLYAYYTFNDGAGIKVSDWGNFQRNFTSADLYNYSNNALNPRPTYLNKFKYLITYPANYNGITSSTSTVSIKNFTRISSFGFKGNFITSPNALASTNFDEFAVYLENDTNTYTGTEVGWRYSLKDGGIRGYIDDGGAGGFQVATPILINNDNVIHTYNITITNFTASFYIDGQYYNTIVAKNTLAVSYNVVFTGNRHDSSFATTSADNMLITNVTTGAIYTGNFIGTPTWITSNCQFGGCVSFGVGNGGNTITTPILPPNRGTVTGWVYVTANSDFSVPFGWKTNSANFLIIDPSSSASYKWTGKVSLAGVSSSVFCNAANYISSSWQFLSFSWDGSLLTTYQNGVSCGTAAYVGNIVTVGNTFSIGGSNSGQNFFKGNVDEVRVYSTALSANEINDLYLNTNPTNSILFSQMPAWGTGAFTVNLVVKDGASTSNSFNLPSTGNVFGVNAVFISNLFTASNSPVVYNQIQLISAGVTGGTTSYTYNFLVYNSAGLVTNMLIVGNSITQNTFSFSQSPLWGSGTFTVNTFIKDSASTPVTVSNTLTYTSSNPVTGVSLIPSNAVVDQNQYETLVYTISGGTQPYTYNFVVTNIPGANQVVNQIFTGCTLTTNTFSFQVPTINNALGSITIYANVVDSAGVNMLLTTTITINKIFTPFVFNVNAFVDQGQTQRIHTIVSGGTSPYTYNFLVYNSVGFVTNMLVSNIQVANDFAFIQSSTWGIGQFVVNSLITDSATTPAQVSNTLPPTCCVYSVNTVPSVAVTVSNTLIDQTQTQVLTATITGGTGNSYTYNYIVSNSAGQVANQLFTGCTIRTNTFVFTQDASWGTGAFTYNLFIKDGATQIQMTAQNVGNVYGSNIIITQPTISPSVNTFYNNGQTITIATYATGGTTPLTYNFIFFNSITNAILANQLGSSNSFLITANTFMVGNTFKVNVTVTDSATSPYRVNSVKSGIISVNAALAQPTISPSGATIYDNGQTITVATYETGGSPPYTYNFIFFNSITNLVIANQLGSSNSFIISSNTFMVGNTFKANVAIIDNALATTNSVKTGVLSVNSALVAGDQTPSSLSVDGGQAFQITSHASGGTAPYSYVWRKGAFATCLAYSAISGQTSSVLTNTLSPGSGGSINQYCYEVTDSATTPTNTFSSLLTLSVRNELLPPTLTLSNTPTVQVFEYILFNAFMSSNGSDFPGSGSPPYLFNYIIQNTVTGVIVGNALYSSSGDLSGIGVSNTFLWQVPGNLVGNTLKVNVIVTDSATTPVTVNSVYSATLTVISAPPPVVTFSPSNQVLYSNTVVITANAYPYGVGETVNILVNGVVAATSSTGNILYSFNSLTRGTGVFTINAYDTVTGVSNVFSLVVSPAFITFYYYPGTCTNNWNGAIPCIGSVTYTQNTVLSGNLNVSGNILIQSGVSLTTNGYSYIIAGGTNGFSNFGTIRTGSSANNGIGGTNGANGISSFNSLGGSGGAGGGQGAGLGGYGGNTFAKGGVGSVGAGTSGTNVVTPTITNAGIRNWLSNGMQQTLIGAGGGGGAGSAGQGDGGRGGYGLYIQATNIIGGAIIANGIKGFDATNANGAAGAGGGGGTVILSYNSQTSNSISTNVLGGSNGISGANAMISGSGGNGLLLTFQWTTPPLNTTNPSPLTLTGNYVTNTILLGINPVVVVPSYYPFTFVVNSFNGVSVTQNVITPSGGTLTTLFTSNTGSFNYTVPSNQITFATYNFIFSTGINALANTVINVNAVAGMPFNVLSQNAFASLGTFANSVAIQYFPINILSNFLPLPSNWLLDGKLATGNTVTISSSSTTNLPLNYRLNYPFTSFNFSIATTNAPAMKSFLLVANYVGDSPPTPYTRLLIDFTHFDEITRTPLNSITTFSLNALFNNYTFGLSANLPSANEMLIYMANSAFINPDIKIFNESSFTSSNGYLPKQNNFFNNTFNALGYTQQQIYLTPSNSGSLYPITVTQCNVYPVGSWLEVKEGGFGNQVVSQIIHILQGTFSIPLITTYPYQFIILSNNALPQPTYTSGLSTWTSPISLTAPCVPITVNPVIVPDVHTSCHWENLAGNMLNAFCSGYDSRNLINTWIINWTNRTTLLTSTVMNTMVFSGNSFSANYIFPSNQTQWEVGITADWEPYELYTMIINPVKQGFLPYNFSLIAIALILLPFVFGYFRQDIFIIAEIFLLTIFQALTFIGLGQILPFTPLDLGILYVLSIMILVYDWTKKGQ